VRDDSNMFGYPECTLKVSKELLGFRLGQAEIRRRVGCGFAGGVEEDFVRSRLWCYPRS